jgi:hypothetical protein
VRVQSVLFDAARAGAPTQSILSFFDCHGGDELAMMMALRILLDFTCGLLHEIMVVS